MNNYWKAIGGALGGLLGGAVSHYGPMLGVTLTPEIATLVAGILGLLGAYFAPANKGTANA
jgi:hypothetical protein